MAGAGTKFITFIPFCLYVDFSHCCFMYLYCLYKGGRIQYLWLDLGSTIDSRLKTGLKTVASRKATSPSDYYPVFFGYLTPTEMFECSKICVGVNGNAYSVSNANHTRIELKTCK